jgi:hypothetical protein
VEKVSSVSHHDERGLGASRAGQDPLADFDALRARRMAEQEADGYEATAPIHEYEYSPGYGYEYGTEPTRLVGGVTPPPPSGRGKLRSTVVFVGMVLFVVGLGAGVYAATRPSGGTQATAAVPPTMAPSPSASSGAGASAGNPGMSSSTDSSPNMGSGPSSGTDMGSGGNGSSTQPSQMPMTTARGTLTMLSVIDVGNTSFTATTTRGATVTVQVNSQTQFGTQAQPFSPSDLVPGAVVWARVRRDPDGDGNLIATLIAGTGMNGQAVQASPTNGGGNGNSGD